tara:strand:- start:287 stop:913 length:627 start_codon:yes stop_codon:yes gene_type:complete
MTTTTQLALTHLVEGQTSAELTLNDSINKLDAVIHLSVKDRDLTAPPGSPTEGDRYLVKATGTGDWASQDGNVAVYLTGWSFLTPKEGWTIWVDDEDVSLRYTGSAWQHLRTVQDSVTASVTQTQAAGTALTGEVVRVTVCGFVDNAVTLPTAEAGRKVFIYNIGGNRVQIFPASGDQIRDNAVDASVTLNDDKGRSFYAVSETVWVY